MSTHEPAPPAEPKTPLWLPALGAALFLVVGIWWATSGDTKPAPDAAQPDSAQDAGAIPPPGEAKN